MLLCDGCSAFNLPFTSCSLWSTCRERDNSQCKKCIHHNATCQALAVLIATGRGCMRNTPSTQLLSAPTNLPTSAARIQTCKVLSNQAFIQDNTQGTFLNSLPLFVPLKGLVGPCCNFGTRYPSWEQISLLTMVPLKTSNVPFPPALTYAHSETKRAPRSQASPRGGTTRGRCCCIA